MSEVDGTRLDDARDISESRGGLAPSPLPVRLYRARSVRNRCQCGYDLSIVRVSANVYMADQLGQRQQAFVLNKTHSFTSPLTLTAWAWFAYRRQRFGLIHDPRTFIFFPLSMPNSLSAFSRLEYTQLTRIFGPPPDVSLRSLLSFFVFLYLSVCEALKLRSLPFTHPIYVASRYFQ